MTWEHSQFSASVVDILPTTSVACPSYYPLLLLPHLPPHLPPGVVDLPLPLRPCPHTHTHTTTGSWAWASLLLLSSLSLIISLSRKNRGQGRHAFLLSFFLPWDWTGRDRDWDRIRKGEGRTGRKEEGRRNRKEEVLLRTFAFHCLPTAFISLPPLPFFPLPATSSTCYTFPLQTLPACLLCHACLLLDSTFSASYTFFATYHFLLLLLCLSCPLLMPTMPTSFCHSSLQLPSPYLFLPLPAMPACHALLLYIYLLCIILCICQALNHACHVPIYTCYYIQCLPSTFFLFMPLSLPCLLPVPSSTFFPLYIYERAGRNRLKY